SPVPQQTSFVPGHGAQMLQIDATHVLLQGHHDTNDDAFMQVYNTQTLMPAGGSVSLPNLRTAALLTAGTQQYVLAGYPSVVVDGKTAGEVQVFRVSAAGIETSPVATLQDAQPENNQSFGRAVAAMPYHGMQLIAVAADNEIFVYFRANLADGTQLYGETRQG